MKIRGIPPIKASPRIQCLWITICSCLLFSVPIAAKAAPGPHEYSVQFNNSVGKVDLDWAYDNVFTFESVAVTGDEQRSFERERTTYIDEMNIRTLGTIGNETNVEGALRVQRSSDPEEKDWDFKTFYMSFQAPRHTLALYDMSPTFSNYALKNRNLEGIYLSVNIKSFRAQLVFGDDPDIADALGLRREVGGIRLDTEVGKGSRLGFNWVMNQERDTGARPGTLKIESEIYSVDFSASIGPRIQIETEAARSESGPLGDGNAFRIKAGYKTRNTRIKADYETVSNYFRAESGSFVEDRTRFQGSAQYNFSRMLNIVVGFKDQSYLGGARTQSVPIVLSLVPWSRRKSLKSVIKLEDEIKTNQEQKTFQRTSQVNIRDKFGELQLTLDWRNRMYRNYRNEWSRKTTGLIQAVYPLSRLLEASLRLKRESQGLRKTGFYTLNLSYSLSDWSDFRIMYDIKNDSRSELNKRTIRIAYSDVNNDASREISIDSFYSRFTDHIDKGIKVRIGFYY